MSISRPDCGTFQVNKSKEKLVCCPKFTEYKGVNIPILSTFLLFNEIIITNLPKRIDFRRKV